MNTDAYFEIGSSHRVCEDYALSGVYEDMAYAIVSDGCSSSKHSDVGSRLLAHIAQGAIKHLKKRSLIVEPSYATLFRELVIKKCTETQQTLSLTPDIFDATLLTCVVHGSKITLLGWGDGYFIFTLKDGSRGIIEIKFSSGAPYYLSYELSQDKKESYRQAFGKDPVTMNTYYYGPEGALSSIDVKENIGLMDHTVYNVLEIDDVRTIAMTSDGTDTYEDDPKFESFDGAPKKCYKAIEMIPTIVGYKNTVGEFVNRRMTRLRSDNDKSHILHYDDVSCAAIALE